MVTASPAVSTSLLRVGRQATKEGGTGIMAAAKKSVLSSLAVYAEDSEPESDSEAGGAGSERGTGPGEVLVGLWRRGKSHLFLEERDGEFTV